MSSRRPTEAVRLPTSSAPPSVEFQRQWQTGQEPRIETFLSSRPAISVSELAAVVRIDLRQRWRRGEQLGASDYLARFPQLLADATLVVDLIYTEFLVREELGERLHLSLLQRQFPEYAEELTAQVEFHHALENSALETSEEQPGNGAETEPHQETLGPRAKAPTRLPSLGPAYEVLAEIGRGGMGVVYRARQVGLNRLVALKMVRGAEYASAELLARFRAEAEAVARLHHPQIVQTYDYGEHDGLPYLAMELVEGGTLAARLDGTPWPAGQAAALMETLARAVEFAHHRGVIHRDLKPANILLCSKFQVQSSKLDSTNVEPGTLNCELNVKITDFGLAKAFREQSSEQTQSGALLGTPSYMAPEQAAGQALQIGPAADVYALGAILYELLTGRPPYRGETPIATLQQVLTSEPVSIRLLAPRVPRDLATICSKCLRREPEQRYRSAEELADDLARLLADQPIRARPTGSSERAWRWCRRNPALAILGGAVALLLLTVAGVSSLSSVRLGAQLQKTARAEDAERTAKLDAQARLWDSYLAEITARTASRQIGQRSQSLATVDKASALLPDIGRTPERVLRLRNAVIAALALPDISRVQPANPWSVSATQTSFCTAADRCAVRTSEGELIVFRLSDGTRLCSLEESGVVGNSHISPDGRFVALFQEGVKVWQIDGSAPTVVWQESNATYFTFAPDGRHAAVCGADGAMRLLDVELGREIRRLGRGSGYSDFAFHMPTRQIALRSKTGFQIIGWDTGEVLKELPPPDTTHPFNNTDFVAWHPSGDHLLVGSFAGGAVLVDVASAKRAMVYPHRSRDMSARFLNGGELLCTYSIVDGSLRLWHTSTGRELLGDSTFSNFAWDQSPESRKMLRWSDSDLEVWEVATATACSVLPQGLHPALVDVHSLAISPDGRLLAIGRSKGLELWDLVSGRHWLEKAVQYSFVKFTQNGDLIVSGPSGVMRWPRKIEPATSEAAISEIVISYGPPQQLAGKSENCTFAIDPSGHTLAVEPTDTGCRVIRVDKPEDVVRLVTPQSGNRMAITSDGLWVAVANEFGPAGWVFNAMTGQRVAELSIGTDGLPLFSPDNRWLAAASDGVRVWRASDWSLATELHTQGRTLSAQEIAFSPDSRVLAVGQPSGVIRLTDPATGEDWAAFTDPDKSPGGFLAFSPDQSKLIAMEASELGAPRIWDLAAIRHELALRGLDWPKDVLQPQANASSIAAATRLVVTFHIGSLLKKDEAGDLVYRAQKSSPEKALELFQQAVQTDPEYALAHNHLAWFLATGPDKLRRAKHSLEHARRAVALEPGNQAYLNTLGIALCRNAHYDEAIPILERSLSLSVDEGVSFDLLFLALAHAGKGDAKAARDYYTRAKASFDARSGVLTKAYRDEFSRLSNEARAAIVP